MLVKKNVLNKINKQEAFTQAVKDCKEIKKKVLDNLQNFVIKLNETVS